MSAAARFTKRSATVTALQFTGGVESACEVMEFTRHRAVYDLETDTLTVYTVDGDMRAQAGDWLVRGVRGEVYPCTSDVFALAYSRVEEDAL